MKTETQHKQQKKEKLWSMKKSKKHADPSLDDHLQQIPQCLREIMKSKESMKQGSWQRKKAPKPKLPEGVNLDIPVPHFCRGRQESEKAYLCRMTQEIQHVLFLTNNQNEEEEQTEENKSTKKKGCGILMLVAVPRVAKAPPSLSVKPKKATVKPQGAPRGLLLNSLLGHSPVSVSKPTMARKRINKEERERVVQLYRQMKKQQRDKHEQDKAARMNST
ncbi:coiled-coil domain-containing protein 137-like [Myxocyprinus asiaticus]|uniref:coiled-coil domain-containing protein 137-like n=1 Tax=Myxocyprinus asiaticus TaxID=70543 RepID=UPI002221BF72|nr:coiled-coil domain-containing protein 137-like [Myxocyprinus asiaticus]